MKECILAKAFDCPEEKWRGLYRSKSKYLDSTICKCYDDTHQIRNILK